MFNFLKKKEKETIKATKQEGSGESDRKKTNLLLSQFQKEKKDLLPKGTLTREEIVKEIEKQFLTKKSRGDNPFKTSEDVYYNFFDSSMKLARANVPFEEVKVGGKSFFINKRFDGGKIIIEEMFCSPDLEIDLKEEYDKKETTKQQLSKINKYILTIKNKIAKGDEQYLLLDMEDLKEEKWRLEKNLESIKYGKSAIFAYENPINNKKTYMLRYTNGEYKYLKVTENNYLTEENNIKFIKGYEIQKRLESITNLRITKNWKEIAIALFVIMIAIGTMFALFKALTFEETLFDKRVQDFCGVSTSTCQTELENMRDWKCSLTIASAQNTATYNIPK